MSPDAVMRKTQLLAQLAHLVLKELTQRLDELELHILLETAHVVVGLDGDGGTTEGDGLDDIGVERSLEEEVDVADLGLDLLSLFLEHLVVNEEGKEG